MYYIFEFLTHFIISQNSSSCDDFIDRLNRKYTVILILVFVTILTSKQYIGEPLACFCPAHFTGAHVEYTNNICWISTSFYVPVETSFSWSTVTTKSIQRTSHDSNSDEIHFQFPNNSNLKFARIDNLIAFYPFLLIGQAILFYIPYFFWKNIINRSAYDLATLIYIASDAQSTESQVQREKNLRYLIKHMERANQYYNTEVSLDRKFNEFDIGKKKKDKNISIKVTKMSEEIDGTNIDSNCNKQRFNNKIESLSASFKKIMQNLNLTEFNERETDIVTTVISNRNDLVKRNGLKSNQINLMLFTIYLIIKITYIFNCLLQFLILNKFVSDEKNQKKSMNIFLILFEIITPSQQKVMEL